MSNKKIKVLTKKIEKIPAKIFNVVGTRKIKGIGTDFFTSTLSKKSLLELLNQVNIKIFKISY